MRVKRTELHTRVMRKLNGQKSLLSYAVRMYGTRGLSVAQKGHYRRMRDSAIAQIGLLEAMCDTMNRR